MAIYELSLLVAFLCSVACLFMPIFKAVGGVKLRWSRVALVCVGLALAAWWLLWFAAGIIANV